MIRPPSLSRALGALGALALAGCVQTTHHPLPDRVESFQLEVDQVSPSNPPAQTGDDPNHMLPIPVGQVRVHVKVSAVGPHGELYTAFARPLSFGAIPGNVVDVLDDENHSTGNRMLPATAGQASGWLVIEKVFGDVYVRVSDEAPRPIYGPADYSGDIAAEHELAADAGTDAGAADDAGIAVDESERTHASGVSRTIYFERPLLADLQRPKADSACKIDNRLSPFTGNFLTVEAPEGVGDMIVTAVTSDGFYVTDKAAQRLPVNCYASTVGTFAHMYVFNYNFPDGLSVGDRLVSLTGTVQEFSGTTQITFPSWVRLIGDPRPQEVPAPLVFDFLSTDPVSLGYRLCKTATGYAPKAQTMDTLCAYSNSSTIDMESIESSLVKLVAVRPSTVFKDCDSNGNGNVPPFAWIVPELPAGGPDYDNAHWGCYDSDNDPSTPDPDMPDCQCAADCVTGTNGYAGKICSELTTYHGYGQFIVQLEDVYKVRMAVSVRDALPLFEPRDFDEVKHPEHQGCTLDVVGIIKQVQAARPRWLVTARTKEDVCCRAPAGKSCPSGIPICP